jgi:hypothetical protein
MANTIAAGCNSTTARTGIGINSVSIVAGLTRIDAPIATNFAATVARAAVFVFAVTIVAFFKLFVFRSQIAAPDAVAAARRFAGVCAGIEGVAVSIVTEFMVCPDDSIPANRRGATVEARVVVVVVAVVATLSILNPAIAAAGGLAIGAIVDWVVVTVVASFAGPDDAISAARLLAIVQAAVAFFIVAVVAAFKTEFAFKQVVATNRVAAARQNAA